MRISGTETLISDPKPNKVVLKVEKWCPFEEMKICKPLKSNRQESASCQHKKAKLCPMAILSYSNRSKMIL